MPPENDANIPQPVGGGVIAPKSLDPKLTDLGRRLDDLFSANGRTERPSEWLSGAVFASDATRRGNPDWIAQAAHSLREILYRLCSPRYEGGDDAIRESLTRYGSAQNIETSLIEVNTLYRKLCQICHHEIKIEDTDERNFDNLLATFDRVMSSALEQQLEVHAEIEALELPPAI